MSKIALTPNDSGTGTFTIQSPDSDTNRTFTLPDASGELSVGKAFSYDSVSGATQDLDLDDGNFFDAGTLTADTTLTFSNVPTEANWRYTAIFDSQSFYDLADASYDSVSFDVSSQSSYPQHLRFSSDGTKLYVVNSFSTIMYQYSLSTAWDISTASYDSKSFSPTSQMTFVMGFSFKPDGTKLYIASRITADGSANEAKIYQYSLSTAWDLSTASYDSKVKDIGPQDTYSSDVFFKSDGLKMYVLGRTGDNVYQYSLSTAWDVSSASYDSLSADLSGQVSDPIGFFISEDGFKFFVSDTVSEAIYEYQLSTAWNMGTAVYNSVSFDPTSQDTAPFGVTFGNDGKKMYVGGTTNDTIYQYTVGSGTTITLPASVQNSTIPDTDAGDHLTLEFYTADGGTNVHVISTEVAS